MLVVLVSVAAFADEPPPRIATGRVSTFTGLPDLLGASVTLHVIPWVDVEVGGSALLLGTTLWARGGPRYLLGDWLDESCRGLTLTVSALFGYKWVEALGGVTRGFHFAGAFELTRWLSPHLGVAVQVAGGGTFDPGRTNRRVFPDLRLSFGVAL